MALSRHDTGTSQHPTIGVWDAASSTAEGSSFADEARRPRAAESSKGASRLGS
jgi:hypothetical protein